MNQERIPEIMRRRARFCCWRMELRGGNNTKVPYSPQRPAQRAKANDPATFGSFEDAMRVANDSRWNMNGIGVGLFGGLCAIDIDHCVEDGRLSPMAEDVLAIMRSPVEYSPSGTGLHIYFYAKISFDRQRWYINNRDLGLEVYIGGETNKYVTVTGNALNDLPIEDRSVEIVRVLDKYMRHEAMPQADQAESRALLTDNQVLERAMAAKNGEKFALLWNGNTAGYASHSEADMALCSMLAFWCGRDAAQMDRLFRRSGLMREKWNEKRGGDTYGAEVLRKSTASCAEVYKPASNDISDDPELQRLRALKPWENSRYLRSDLGNGFLFADFFKGTARYVSERKCWYIYDGIAWRSDVGGLLAMEKCKLLALLLRYTIGNVLDEAVQKEYAKNVNRWQDRRVRLTILNDAASVYPLVMSAFNRDPWLFNCPNGTLDLRTRAFREHRAEDFLTMVSGVNYDPSALCERWEQYIEEIMEIPKPKPQPEKPRQIEMSDAFLPVNEAEADVPKAWLDAPVVNPALEKATYLQKAIGYALTGSTEHECLFMLYGATTRNGKGTLCETLVRMLGDYARTAKPETIGTKYQPNGSGPSEDIARLNGARFVNISEPDKSLTLSAALVKSLTGNDTITARYLHENSFEFRPHFKLFINTNHLPQITDMTLFTSNRVKVIPFERHFEECEQDHGLKARFEQPENLSGILNWAIDGLHKLLAEGFATPGCIRQAIEAYRKSSDKIAQFVEECLIRGDDREVRTSEVYSRYQEWCQGNGYRAENQRNFKQMLATYGAVVRKRPNNGGGLTTMLTGYCLQREVEPL